jgi:hypothetical protein
MSLRAIEALARPAMVTNENFFSHADPVFTAGALVCQALFSWEARADFDERLAKGLDLPEKKSTSDPEKSLPMRRQFLQCARIRSLFS